MINLCSTIIRWTFYSLFFLVPLVFYSGSHELFEYNKMMLTYGLTTIIVGAWVVKMVFTKKVIFRRTFFDIPLWIYLGSHILSTVFSIDFHTSIWGYYSRFHEGLLATISYVFLYHALVSNLDRKAIYKIFIWSFISAFIISIWGILEHTGHSISCAFIPPYNFDVSCWIQDVKNRVYATLGQPNWMAAYMDIIILSVVGIILENKKTLLTAILYLLTAIFFTAFLFTNSLSGLAGLLVGIAFLSGFYVFKNYKNIIQKPSSLLALSVLLALFALLVFIFGIPVERLKQHTLAEILKPKQTTQQIPVRQSDGYIDIGISSSGDIRKIVWKGAIDIWKRYPILGSGVETFAYSYYLDRPKEHNNVSEWDFLYNKAHNEFLNILATTGTVGMVAYLFLVFSFFRWILKNIVFEKQIAASQAPRNDVLIASLFAVYLSIIVTNFFGFSVVIVGIYFFLIPGFSILLSTSNSEPSTSNLSTSTGQFLAVGLICLAVLSIEWKLMNMWHADVNFALGKNLDSIQEYIKANEPLNKAVTGNPDEPTFKDELAFNNATLAALINQEATDSATKAFMQQYIETAIKNSNEAVTVSPNNLIFWKNRTKVFYQLATIDKSYILQSLDAITTAEKLAPTDARVHYNMAIIQGRSGQTEVAIKTLEETIALKADYRDPRYALALYRHQEGKDDLAREQLEFILKKIGDDTDAKKLLDQINTKK